MRNLWRPLLLLGLTAAIRPALACSCVSYGGGACQSAKSAPVIFVGRVLAESKGQDTTTYKFSVTEFFRTDPALVGATADVSTAADGGMCGETFQAGLEYLVYASVNDGMLSTSLCSGNKTVSAAAADLRYLRGVGHDALSKGGDLPGFVFGWLTNRKGDLTRFLHQPTWPEAGIRVRAVEAKGGAVTAETTTASDGSFEFFNLSAGRYRLAVDPPGVFDHETADTPIADLYPGACVARRFFRSRMAKLEGRLFDADGEPDETSHLILERVGSRPLEPGENSELEAEADEGKFQFEVPPGRYRLAVREFGYLDLHYLPQEFRLTDAAPTTIEYRLRARPTKSVLAMVVDPEGKPIAGVKVWLSGHLPDGAALFGSIITPDSGRIRFTDIPFVDVKLRVDAPPGCEAPQAEVRPGDTEETKLVFARKVCGR